MLVDVGDDIYLPGTIQFYGLKSVQSNERYFSEYCRVEGIRNHFRNVIVVREGFKLHAWQSYPPESAHVAANK